MTEQDVAEILTQANNNLTQHPDYESWMGFDGAKVTPLNQIIPTFKTKDGKSGFQD